MKKMSYTKTPRITFQILLIAFLISCNTNNTPIADKNAIDLTKILKSQSEKEVYTFKLDSIEPNFHSTSIDIGIFIFKSNQNFELRGNWKGELFSDVHTNELFPFAPTFFRNNKEVWENYNYGFLCGTGIDSLTLLANKEYKMLIGLDYFNKISCNGVVAIGEYKSDVFDVKKITKKIYNLSNSGSILINKNQILAFNYFNHIDFKNCNLTGTNTFDLKDFYGIKDSGFIEIKTYLTLGERFLIFKTIKTDNKEKSGITTEIAAFENKKPPKLLFLYTSKERNEHIYQEGILTINDKTYSLESINYSDTSIEKNTTEPIVHRKLDIPLPPNPIIYTPSIHVIGPQLFPEQSNEKPVVEIGLADWVFPADFSHSYKNLFLSKIRNNDGSIKIVLNDKSYEIKTTWDFSKSGEFKNLGILIK